MSKNNNFNNFTVQVLKNETFQRAFASLFIVSVSILLTAFLYSKLFVEPKTITREPEISAESIKNAVTRENTILSKIQSMNSVSIYEGLTTPQSLIDACVMGKKIAESCNKEVAKISKFMSIDGVVIEAYLYIKAAISRESSPISALTKYDSIWFLLDKEKHSGQLLRSKAIHNGISEEGFTEIIFDLSNVSFTHLPYNDNAQPDSDKESDLLKTLNSSNKHIISSFIATLGYGKIVEMKIYYKGGLIKVI